MIHKATEFLLYGEVRTLCGKVALRSYSAVREEYVTCGACREALPTT